MLLKTCTKCNKSLEATEEHFRKGKGYKYGLRSHCRSCESESRKENRVHESERWRNWAEKNKEYVKKYNHDKWENNKEKYKPAREIYYQKNKEVIFEQNRRWVANNPDKVREIGRNCKRRRDSRKRNLKSDLTIAEWQETLLFFGNKCSYCQKYFEILEQDHFIPVTKGGEHTNKNIIPACRQCNASKSDKDFEEWFIKQSFFDTLQCDKIIKFTNG